MSLITKRTIEDFFTAGRIAVIGASRSPRKFGRRLLDELQVRGFEVVAINPNTERLGNIPCHRSILEVPVATAIAVVPPSEQAKVALECVRAGVQRLWMYDHVMKGLSDPRAIQHCEEAGIEVVTGYCPFMFLPRPGFPHNLHGTVLKWLGGYPR